MTTNNKLLTKAMSKNNRLENIFETGMKYGFLFLAFFLPISISATNIVLGFLLLFWIGLMITRKKIIFEKTVILLPIIVFLIISSLSAIGAVNVSRAIKGIKSDFLVLLFFLIACNIGDRRQIKRILFWFLIGTLIVSSLGILQFIIGVNESNGVITYKPTFLAHSPEGLLKMIALHTKRVVSTRSHPLTLAGGLLLMLSLFAPLLFYKGGDENRKIMIITSILAFIAFFLTHSRGPLFALVGVVIFIEIVNYKKTFPYFLLIFLAILLLLGGVLFTLKRDLKAKRFIQFKDLERIHMWQTGLTIISDRPLLGVGPKNISEVYEKYRMPGARKRRVWGELHNNFIQIASERGILGLGAFLWIWISFFIWSFRWYRKIDIRNKFNKLLNLGCLAALVGFHLSGMFEYNYGDSEVIMMLWFIMGLNVALIRESKHNPERSNVSPKFVVFLDRDGTLCHEKGYINHPENLILIPRAGKSIRLLNEVGALAIVATNQSGIARTFLSEEVLEKIHQRLNNLLAKNGAYLDALYYCPHHPDAVDARYRMDCECRKPKTGMFKRALKEFNIREMRYYMIGDRSVDVEWGHKIGAYSILVLTGYGKGEFEYQRDKWKDNPDYIAQDLYDAVKWILKKEKRQTTSRENRKQITENPPTPRLRRAGRKRK